MKNAMLDEIAKLMKLDYFQEVVQKTAIQEISRINLVEFM